MQSSLPSFNDGLDNLWAGIGLNQDQISKLSALVDGEGLPRFRLGDTREINYSVAAWIKTCNFDQIYLYLLEHQGYSNKELIFNSKTGEKIREHHEEEIDSSVFRPREASGIYVCPDCGSDKVRTIALQTRGADEPFTIFANCTSCGFRWDEE